MRYAVTVRFGRRLLLAAMVAAIAAAPSFADGSTPPPTSTTTTQTATPAPKAAAGASTTRTTFRVNTIFPAAGQLLVNSVPARVSPSPHARVIKVMHMFRPDYRTQEILALSTEVRLESALLGGAGGGEQGEQQQEAGAPGHRDRALRRGAGRRERDFGFFFTCRRRFAFGTYAGIVSRGDSA